MTVDHDEDINKEIRISLSIFWDIAVQGGNEVKRSLSLYFSMSRTIIFEIGFNVTFCSYIGPVPINDMQF